MGSTRIDDYGCICTIEKADKETFKITLKINRGWNQLDCDVTLNSYVDIEELKSTIRMLEDE